MLDARLEPVVAEGRAGAACAARSRAIAALPTSSSRRWCRKQAPRRSGGAWKTRSASCDAPKPCLAASDDAWRELGLSRAKAETLRGVARAVASGELDLAAICSKSKAAVAIRELTSIKGVGRWTAEVYLLFCAGHPDVFPVGDVALQNAVGHALALEVRPVRPRELDSLAEIWAPWRSVAARLFWAYYAQKCAADGLPVGIVRRKANCFCFLFPFGFTILTQPPNIEGADAESIRRASLTIAVSPQALPALVLNADYGR